MAFLATRTAVVDVRNPLAGPRGEQESAAIIGALLDNVHTAHLEIVDERLDRALRVVVAEDNFTDIKTELGRALAIKVAGGGIARVRSVQGLVVQDIAEMDDRSGFPVRRRMDRARQPRAIGVIRTAAASGFVR